MLWRSGDANVKGGGGGGLGTWVWIFMLHPCLHGGLETGVSRVEWRAGDTCVDLRAPSLLPQLRQRFELEIERMKQMHQKDREDQEEELEDVRQSCQKRVCELWAQCIPRSHRGGCWNLRSVGMLNL